MNIKINSNFQFSVVSIQYAPNGELCISLDSDNFSSASCYQYTASLGDGHATERPCISLLQYCKDFASAANIKPQTKDSYRLMCRHLEAYGDTPMDKVTTEYLQGFFSYLHSRMQQGTVRLYFQKLTCVLHYAYKNELFRRPYPAACQTPEERTAKEKDGAEIQRRAGLAMEGRETQRRIYFACRKRYINNC